MGGQGLANLQNAFLHAGAEYVITSLWKVDDEGTRWFMDYLYQFLLEEGDVRRAFKKAQDKLRETHPSPFYWGAFVLVER